MIIKFITGFLSGIIGGMGIGGGSILIPALVIFNGMSQHKAQAINLIYFIPTGATALFFHARNKTIETKNLKMLILFGISGAIFGAIIANNIDPTWLRKLFGGFLLVMGIWEMFRKSANEKK